MLRKDVTLYDTSDPWRRKKLKGNLKTVSDHFSEKESDELPVLTFCLKEKLPALQQSEHPHVISKRRIETCVNAQIGNDFILFKQNEKFANINCLQIWMVKQKHKYVLHFTI